MHADRDPAFAARDRPVRATRLVPRDGLGAEGRATPGYQRAWAAKQAFALRGAHAKGLVGIEVHDYQQGVPRQDDPSERQPPRTGPERQVSWGCASTVAASDTPIQRTETSSAIASSWPYSFRMLLELSLSPRISATRRWAICAGAVPDTSGRSARSSPPPPAGRFARAVLPLGGLEGRQGRLLHPQVHIRQDAGTPGLAAELVHRGARRRRHHDPLCPAPVGLDRRQTRQRPRRPRLAAVAPQSEALRPPAAKQGAPEQNARDGHGDGRSGAEGRPATRPPTRRSRHPPGKVRRQVRRPGARRVGIAEQAVQRPLHSSSSTRSASDFFRASPRLLQSLAARSGTNPQDAANLVQFHLLQVPQDGHLAEPPRQGRTARRTRSAVSPAVATARRPAAALHRSRRPGRRARPGAASAGTAGGDSCGSRFTAMLAGQPASRSGWRNCRRFVHAARNTSCTTSSASPPQPGRRCTRRARRSW